MTVFVVCFHLSQKDLRGMSCWGVGISKSWRQFFIQAFTTKEITSTTYFLLYKIQMPLMDNQTIGSQDTNIGPFSFQNRATRSFDDSFYNMKKKKHLK